MPRLSEFYGIVILMYLRDRSPPHFHAQYGEYEALVGIHDGLVIRGSLPRIADNLVQQWLELHRSEFLSNWQLAQRPSPLVAIDPLQ